MWLNRRWLAALGAILLWAAGVHSDRAEIFPLSCGQSDDPCSRYDTEYDCTSNECRWDFGGSGKCDRPVYDQLLVVYLLEPGTVTVSDDDEYEIVDARIQFMEISRDGNNWDDDVVCSASDSGQDCQRQGTGHIFELNGDGRCGTNSRDIDVNAIGVNPKDTKVYGMIKHKLDCGIYEEVDCNGVNGCNLDNGACVEADDNNCFPYESFFSRIDIDTKNVEYLQRVEETAHSVAGTFDSDGNYWKFASNQLYKIENARDMVGKLTTMKLTKQFRN